jgi:hypothetical protein
LRGEGVAIGRQRVARIMKRVGVEALYRRPSSSAAFTGLLLDSAIAIGMDGKAAWRDNVFVERLWRSVN